MMYIAAWDTLRRFLYGAQAFLDILLCKLCLVICFATCTSHNWLSGINLTTIDL